MRSAVVGFLRIGKKRELKFASEQYFRGELKESELEQIAAELRSTHWKKQKEAGIDFISSNDFSFYDGMLDLAVLLNVIPERYRALNLGEFDTYFAMSRGYQGKAGDVKALAMKKWFNTNYHYMVPEFEDHTKLQLTGEKPFLEYCEAKNLGIETKPVIIGCFTFLKLARYKGRKRAKDFVAEIIEAYQSILEKCNALGVQWVQFDEPALVMDLSKEDVKLFKELYRGILSAKNSVKVILETYFGDIRDCYNEAISFDFDGIGVDFVEGKKSCELVKKYGDLL